MYIRFYILIGFAGLLASSCVSPKQITSPYQEALQCYYRSIQSESPNLDCLSDITQMVANNPQDVEAIALAAQIRWHLYLKHKNPGEKKRFIEYLQLLAGTLPYAPRAQDWVEPRLYVFLGDLLIYSANSFESAQPRFFTIEKAFALYKAASHAYQHSMNLISGLESADSVSRGLLREKVNAASGLRESLTGQLATLFILQNRIRFSDTPFESWGGMNRTDLVQKKKETLREQLERVQEGETISGYGDISLLNFIPNSQKSAAELQKMILDDYLLAQPVLSDSCRIVLDPDQPVSETCETFYREAEKAAIYAILFSVLSADPNAPGTLENEAFPEFSKALAECAFCE